MSEADWSEMNEDILTEIINLLELVDFIRAGAVCRSWRRTITGGTSHHLCCPTSDQSPWLMLSSFEEREFRFFYNPTNPSSLYKVHLPNLWNHVLIGSSGGYLISIDGDGRINATNPITGAHRPLPDTTTLPYFGEAIIDPSSGKVTSYLISTPIYGPYVPYHVDFVRYYFHKAIFAPVSCGSIVVLLHFCVKKIVFAHEMDKSWTAILDCPPIYHFDDIVFYKGLLYAVNYVGQLAVFDLQSSSAKQVMVNKNEPKGADTTGKKYLVESLCGSHLFLLARDLTFDPPNGEDIFAYHKTIGFNIYKLDQSKCEWIRVSDFGDDDVVVFVGYNSAVMKSASDCSNSIMGRRNCIYFTDDQYAMPISDVGEEIDPDTYCDDMGIFCLEDQTVMPLELNVDNFKHFHFPPPLWYAPAI